jgi:hypothetical protein
VTSRTQIITPNSGARHRDTSAYRRLGERDTQQAALAGFPQTRPECCISIRTGLRLATSGSAAAGARLTALAQPCRVKGRRAEGVLLTGVYGSGKSSVTEEIAYLLEQRGKPYALLDLDYVSWAGTGTDDRASEFGLMVQNLAVVAANYRRAGIRLFVLAYFVRSPGEVQEVRAALGLPLRVARLTVRLPAIEQRLASDVTSDRRDDARAAAASIAAGEGTGVEDVVISNDRPIGVVARDVMTFLGWR